MRRHALPITDAMRQHMAAEDGLLYLRRALRAFKASGNKRTAERVRLAISSAKGAVRICDYRLTRARLKPTP